MNIVAREMGLDRSNVTYDPDVAIHIPGVANKLTDVLSRRFVKGDDVWAMPNELSIVPECVLPERSSSYYCTTCTPACLTAGETK